MRIVPILLCLLLFSCSSNKAVDNFYQEHKEDPKVLAVRVPQFMISYLSGLSPETRKLIGRTRDIRYMRLPSASADKTRSLNETMNQFTAGNYIEVFRKNDELKRNVVAVREQGKTVREIIVYYNDQQSGTFLYLDGVFNPDLVRAMAREGGFEKMATALVQEFRPMTPTTE